ncbi:HupE/UreJ family protein [Croceiramulus getboli]|nr:HupE/UreJ family protein [Flavobacteriaceae bacterium YJPT1-3]
MADFWLYFKLGLTHVLDWNAYDHLLFLVVITVPYLFKDWKRVFLLVTLFTLGHTASLILSAYEVISVNARIVEFLIPLTILIAALYNIFTAGKKNSNDKLGVLLMSAVFFGLIHGLGFSNYFKMMTQGLSSKILPLVEFALGVEAAQIIIVMVVLIIGFIGQTLFRFSRRDWVMITSAIVSGMVIPILIENRIW